MRSRSLIIFALLAIVANAPLARAQKFDVHQMDIKNSSEEADTTVGPHGGVLNRRGRFNFETCFDPDGIRVYLYDAQHKQINPRGATARCVIADSTGTQPVELVLSKDRKKELPRYRSGDYERGFHLFAEYDFTMVPDGLLRARLKFDQLPGQDSITIYFNRGFLLSSLRGWICRGHPTRIFLKHQDYDLCDQRYLDEVPFIYQCPDHQYSRSDRESNCPICIKKRVPTRQDLEPAKTNPLRLSRGRNPRH